MSVPREWLIELASPFGPFSDPASRREVRAALLAGEPARAARRIVEAWSEGADLPAHLRRDDFDGTAAELLADLAADPSACREVERALTDPRGRVVAIHALALGVHPSAGPAIVALARADVRPPLSAEELVGLASALRTTRGDAARAAVARLLERDVPAAARRDLELALDEMAPR